MDDRGQSAAYTHEVALAALRGGGRQDIRLEPDAQARARIAAALGLLALRKVRMQGRLIPEGRTDWRFEGTLGATVVQPCVATLEPVTTRIEAGLRRRYLADPPDLSEVDEAEIPEDDTIEPLPAVLDLGAVLVEELALNLPLYPRADGAEPVVETYTEPGVAPMTDDDIKPFAGLAGLREKLGDKS